MTQAQAQLSEAVAFHQQGRLPDAEAGYRRVLRTDPGNPEAQRLLGSILRQTGRLPESLEVLAKAAAVHTGHPGVLGEHGMSLLEARRFGEAAAVLGRLADLRPRSVPALLNLGRAHLELLDSDSAVAVLKRAVELAPADVDCQAAMARAYALAGLPGHAVPFYKSAMAGRPDDPSWPEWASALGGALSATGKMDEALAVFRQVQQRFPSYVAAVAAESELLEALSRYEDAARVMDDAAKVHGEHPELAVARSRVLKRRGDEAGAIDLLEQTLRNPNLTAHYRAVVLFALGSMREGRAEYGQAFAAFSEGNALSAHTFDQTMYVNIVDAIISTFSAERLKTLPRSAVRSTRPVFILGMPRSGTSLVEQILDCHPSAFGAGELPDIGRMAARLDRALGVTESYPMCTAAMTQAAADSLANSYLSRLAEKAAGKPGALAEGGIVTDKTPSNYLHLGLIQVLFPGARVIHCMRHPMDNCISCFTTRLHGAHTYVRSQSDLALVYRQYRRLMDHWKSVLSIPIMDVQYEAMVEDQEGMTRRILEFIGLPWDDACLKFHKSSRLTMTASMHQVRKPVYKSSVGRWKGYEPYMTELAEGLRGYL